MKLTKDDLSTMLVAAALATILVVCIAWNWYRANAQSAVYQREGIEMSTWEVFIGVKPAERTINVK